MNSKLILVILTTIIVVFTYVGVKSSTQATQLSDLQLENIEALSDIEQIGGNYYIVDQIPCFSTASEVRADCSYINCFDCKPQAGNAGGSEGRCTNVRTFP